MTNPNLTSLLIVADCSYSMVSIAKEMNAAVQGLLLDQHGQPGDCEVSILQFSNHNWWLTQYADVSAVVTAEVVNPTAGTALLDALGTAITVVGKNFAERKEEDRPGNVVVVVVTDGEENSSRHYNTETIKGMVNEQTTKWGWNFTFLGANIDAWAVAERLGFARDATLQFAPAAGGVTASVASASAYVTRARNAASGGQSVAGYDDDERTAAMKED